MNRAGYRYGVQVIPFGLEHRLHRDAAMAENGYKPRWRIVPVVYLYGRPRRRWVIYRAGVRMWTKTSYLGALDYVERTR